MNYAHFYRASRRYANKRITREEFMTDWEYAQRRQGIVPARAHRGAKRKGEA